MLSRLIIILRTWAFFKKKSLWSLFDVNGIIKRFVNVPNLAPWKVSVSISTVSGLASSMVSFTGSDSASTSKGDDKRKRRWRERDNSRERLLIKGWLLFEEQRILNCQMSGCCLLNCSTGQASVVKRRTALWIRWINNQYSVEINWLSPARWITLSTFWTTGANTPNMY